jgi:hypothetical protein
VKGERQHGAEQGGHEQERFAWTVGNEKRAEKPNARAENDQAGHAEPPQADTPTTVVAP